MGVARYLPKSILQEALVWLACVLSLQLCLNLCNSMDYSPPGSSAHGIIQAGILKWVAISFSRGSSWPRDRTQVSHIADKSFTDWASRQAPLIHGLCHKFSMIKPSPPITAPFSVLSALFWTGKICQRPEFHLGKLDRYIALHFICLICKSSKNKYHSSAPFWQAV